jgi:hypothetical protein
MSRNADRVGAVEQPTDAPQSVKEEKKSIFSFPAPTELVKLPSKGLWYAEGHPLRGKETIEIHYMTTKHEEILVNKSFIEEGVAVDRLLEALIAEQNIKVEELFTCDKNALLIAARISGYGGDYEANVRCPDCGKSTKKQFNLRELKTKEVDVEFSENGTFEIPVHQNPLDPETPLLFVAEMRLMKGGDQRRVEKTAEKRAQRKLPPETIASLMREIVVSIRDAQGNEGTVEELISDAPTVYVSYLREKYNELSPNVDFDFVHECGNCGAINMIRLPVGANFFSA